MKEEKKIPLNVLEERMLERVPCWNPEKAFDTVLSGWRKHPKFKSASRQTVHIREMRDGFAWLKKEEIASFEAYLGVQLL